MSDNSKGNELVEFSTKSNAFCTFLNILNDSQNWNFIIFYIINEYSCTSPYLILYLLQPRFVIIPFEIIIYLLQIYLHYYKIRREPSNRDKFNKNMTNWNGVTWSNLNYVSAQRCSLFLGSICFLLNFIYKINKNKNSEYKTFITSDNNRINNVNATIMGHNYMTVIGHFSIIKENKNIWQSSLLV